MFLIMPYTGKETKMLISIKDYPQFASAHQLLHEFDGAIIAGGLPRDLLTGREYGDIDIFVPVLSKPHLVELTIKATKFATKHDLTIEVAGYYAGGLNVIRVRLGESIDLCFMPENVSTSSDKEPPTDLFSHFDFVCCQAWMERTEEGFIAHATELFNNLNERKVLGFYPHKGELDSHHAIKVLAKYSDYLLLELARPQQTNNVAKQFNDDDIPF
jgi:hypothetical protein